MHDHAHEHGHEHDHEHGHHHSLPEPATREQLEAILQYMIKHNESHVAELENILPAIEKFAGETAGSTARDALEAYKKGNDCLKQIPGAPA